MIKAGSSFFHNGKRSTTGAVILLKGLPYMVTVSHIFQGEGDRLTVNGMKLVVTRILKGYDIALTKLPPYTAVEITEFGSPAELELAVLVNDTRTINYCRVANSGASLLFLGFQCHDMPEPEDSGTPVLQGGKVIGMMTSTTLDTCMGNRGFIEDSPQPVSDEKLLLSANKTSFFDLENLNTLFLGICVLK